MAEYCYHSGYLGWDCDTNQHLDIQNLRNRGVNVYSCILEVNCDADCLTEREARLAMRDRDKILQHELGKNVNRVVIVKSVT